MTRDDNPNLTEYGNGWEHGYQDGLDAAAMIAEEPHPEGSSKRIADRIRSVLARHIEDVSTSIHSRSEGATDA